MTFYLNAMGIINPLGVAKSQVADNLFEGNQKGLLKDDAFIPDKTVIVGRITTPLPDIPENLTRHKSRNNQIALAALMQIQDDIERVIAQYGKERIGVVVGTSTSGIGENEAGIAYKVANGVFPPDYDYQKQNVSDLSEFIQTYLDLSGPALTVSTACTSGVKAIASGMRMIEGGIVDAVIVGGADSLCGLTLNGFDALESLAQGICQPFSKNRDGINIGEGAALFVLSRTVGPVQICGFGETSDAYHMSAPSPDGIGAIAAMKQALGEHEPSQISYINLHGTATRLNDAMEAKAVKTVCAHDVPCSSTKALTGHMLGAAGANELGFLWLALMHGMLPPHIWDGETDWDEIGNMNLIGTGHPFEPEQGILLSNSFAFGGNNVSVAVKKGTVA